MAPPDIETIEEGVRGYLLRGAGRTGIVVLAGSSGRVDFARARLLAEAGATALALQWFGGEGQPPGICEVPLETFQRSIDCLTARGCEHIILVGTSKGAEAALLVAALDDRVDAVMAFSPSSVVWGNIGAGRDGVAWPERSSWSLHGTPLPFVPGIVGWSHDYRDGLISYRRFFEDSLRRAPEAGEAARIPVEGSKAEIILVAGSDDALWPSDWFAKEIARRSAAHGKPVSLIIEPEAGHRVLLPGETTPRSRLHSHGGVDDADARLGARAWDALCRLL